MFWSDHKQIYRFDCCDHKPSGLVDRCSTCWGKIKAVVNLWSSRRNKHSFLFCGDSDYIQRSPDCPCRIKLSTTSIELRYLYPWHPVCCKYRRGSKMSEDLKTNREIFLYFYSLYCIQHWFICHPSDSTVSEDAGMEPRTVVTSALAVRRSNH